MKLNILIIGIGNFASKYIKIINKNFKKINRNLLKTSLDDDYHNLKYLLKNT